MKNALLLALTLVFLSLPIRSAATEQIEHHQEMVEVSDNPELCIECHDSQGEDHHPVSILYPPSGKEGMFFPVSALKANNIHLLDGKVVCISCHNLKNREKGHLVTVNSDSNLCILCHKK